MSNINPGQKVEIQAPPFDFCVARLERRPYRSADGKEKMPARPGNAHYHCCIRCIRAVEPAFVGKALVVPEDVKYCLEDVHLQHLYNEFGVILQI